MFDGWLRINPEAPFTVSEFIDCCNSNLAREFTDIMIEGEVASFKVNQGRWVFFDLKEDDSSINCFMVLSQLTMPIEDGMKVQLQATPKLTRWGRFSLTVKRIIPVGEGNIKKSFELLKKKLTAEGLFDPARKRPLPENLTKIGVISSTAAAGYIDFLKIIDNRWGGLQIKTINTQVQGLAAPEQIIRALDYFNQHGGVEVIAILRGGGSADDLVAFNDEALVRAIAASKIPVITGIGHEVDESLADLAADVRASTPSNAAERLTPDRSSVRRQTRSRLAEAKRFLIERLDQLILENRRKISDIRQIFLQKLDQATRHISETKKILDSLSPEGVLTRGYAIITGKQSPGSELIITTAKNIITTEVKHVKNR